MRNHRNHPRGLEPFKNLRRVPENDQIRKLDQQVPLAIDRIFAWIGDRILDVVIAQMKIAPGVELQLPLESASQLGQPLLNQLRVETKLGVGVRSAYYGG